MWLEALPAWAITEHQHTMENTHFTCDVNKQVLGQLHLLLELIRSAV